MALAQERIAQALNDAYANNLVGRNILGTDFSTDITLTWGAGAYIVGEETALIESLEGERGMPRLKPPYFPAAKGLYMQPTIVNNVESLSNVPWMISEGGQAFADIGVPTSTGMRMFAVSGHINRPGVFEVPQGVTTFRMLFEAPEYGNGIRDGRSLKAFIPGGASAPWFFEEHLDLPLDKPTVDKAGSMLGSGAIVVMDDRTDMVAACWRVVRFFAHESCGKCTPCREGTTWLERILKRMLDGGGRPEDITTLMDVSESISPGIAWPPRQTTICPLGPSAVSPIASAVRRFPEEFDALHRARQADGRLAPPPHPRDHRRCHLTVSLRNRRLLSEPAELACGRRRSLQAIDRASRIDRRVGAPAKASAPTPPPSAARGVSGLPRERSRMSDDSTRNEQADGAETPAADEHQDASKQPACQVTTRGSRSGNQSLSPSPNRNRRPRRR